MKKLLRAACAFAIATLAACQGDAGSTQTTTETQSAAQAVQPIKLTTASAGLVPKTTAKGTTVQLEGRFQSAVVIRRNTDGSLSTSCHDEEVGAEAFMQSAAASHVEVK